jgi:O-antigen/teichoic acid export membrane protein
VQDPSSHIQRGLIWLGSAAALTRLIDLTGTVVVLFFLTKQELGASTIAWAIGMILEGIFRLGLDTAIVQAEHIERKQLDSVFWLVNAVALVSGGIVLAAAPAFGRLFNEADLVFYLMPAVAKLFFLSWSTVPIQLLNRDLGYRSIAGINALATFSAAVARVALALGGAGVWTLLIANALNGLFIAVFAMLERPFWPKLELSFRAIKPLLRVGIFVSGETVVSQLFRNIDYLLLGAVTSNSAIVGMYRLAFDIAMEPAVAVGQVIARTALPVLAKLRLDPEAFGRTFERTLRTLALAVGLVTALTLVLAPYVTQVIRNGEYAEATLLAQALTAVAFVRINVQLFSIAYLARGQSLLSFGFALVSLIVLAASLLLALHSGFVGPMNAMALGWGSAYPVLLTIVFVSASKLLDVQARKLALRLAGASLVIGVSAALGLGAQQVLAEVSQLGSFVIAALITLTAYALLLRVFFRVRLRSLWKLTPEPQVSKQV